ncbi:MAG: hypothetical protein JNK26_05430 [Candidatus Doudnabacteria bacterium]|nr:hypothetical protein [Candidatus Doudnabacteria bacterium]
MTKIFFAAEPDDESRELSPLYKACQKVDTVLKKASALDPQERYETMRDFALEFVAALTALVELVNTLQVHESQDPLWIDVGTSVGRQRSRYEAIMPGAETAVSDKKKKQLPFSRAVLGRIIKSLGGKVPDEK